MADDHPNGHLLGHFSDIIPVKPDVFLGILKTFHNRTCIDFCTNVGGPEFKGGHDAEISSTSPDGPEKIRIFTTACPDDTPIGSNHCNSQQVVNGKAIFTTDPSKSSPQG